MAAKIAHPSEPATGIAREARLVSHTVLTKVAYSPTEFCTAHGFSRTSLYELFKTGRGPRTFAVGRRRLISAEAAAEWRNRMEAETAATAGGIALVEAM